MPTLLRFKTHNGLKGHILVWTGRILLVIADLLVFYWTAATYMPMRYKYHDMLFQEIIWNDGETFIWPEIVFRVKLFSKMKTCCDLG